MTETEDTDLIESARRGDMRAFERLMNKYTPFAGSVAYNIVGDTHIACDIVQESFLKVYRGLPHLTNPRKFKGWLSSIVRTTCIDWLRKEKIKFTSLEKITDESAEPTGKPIASGIKEINPEVEELREKVLHALSSLPRIYQDVIMLRHLRRYTYKEMSEFLGIPIATIESRLYRARLMLKEILKDLYQ
jgi:RNA polymerase sigma-70 factor (ECF subfamily)